MPALPLQYEPQVTLELREASKMIGGRCLTLGWTNWRAVWPGEGQMGEEGSTQMGCGERVQKVQGPFAGGFLGVLPSQVLCQGAGGTRSAGPALPSCVLSPARSPELLRK